MSLALKVMFFMGRFGPFEGQLTRPSGPLGLEYKLTFGPIYVNAAALRAEERIHVWKGRRTVVEGPFSGTIQLDAASLATFGNLSIRTELEYVIPNRAARIRPFSAYPSLAPTWFKGDS